MEERAKTSKIYKCNLYVVFVDTTLNALLESAYEAFVVEMLPEDGNSDPPTIMWDE